MSGQVKKTERNRTGAAALGPGPGRPRGIPNKVSGAVKDMILGALDEVGGQAWLARQAEENPVAFMALISKVLPSELRVGIPEAAFTPETARRMLALSGEAEDGRS